MTPYDGLQLEPSTSIPARDPSPGIINANPQSVRDFSSLESPITQFSNPNLWWISGDRVKSQHPFALYFEMLLPVDRGARLLVIGNVLSGYRSVWISQVPWVASLSLAWKLSCIVFYWFCASVKIIPLFYKFWPLHSISLVGSSCGICNGFVIS